MANNTDIQIRMLAEVSQAVMELKRVEGQMGRLDKQAKKSSSSFDKTTKALKGFSLALGVGASIATVVRSLVKFGKESLAVASRVEELGAKFDVVFGEGANQARQQLSEFGDEVNRSSIDLQDMASEGQNVFVALGLQRDMAAEYSVGLTKLAVDVAAFQNAEDADVLNSFTSAIVGNHIAAKKFGVILNEASLNQALFNMGVKGGMKAATEAEKAIARYNVILNATADSHGAAAREAGSYANVTKGLVAATEDLKAAIGEQLLPTMVSLKIATTNVVRGMADQIEKENLLRTASELGLVTQRDYLAVKNRMGRANKYTNDELIKLIESYEKEHFNLVNLSSSYNEYVGLLNESGISTSALTEAEYANVEASLASAAANDIQTESLRAEGEAMAAVRASLGTLGTSIGDYQEKTIELRAEEELLNGVLNGQISILDTNYGSMEEVSEALGVNQIAQKKSQAAIERTTSMFIFNTIAQDLNAEQALIVARELGILDEKSYYLAETVRKQTEIFADDKDAAHKMAAAIRNARDATIEADGTEAHMYLYLHQIGGGGWGLPGGWGTSAEKSPWRAAGGPVSAGGAYIVGEEGPEILNMGGLSGHIIPNDKLKEVGGNTALLKEMKALRQDIRSMGGGMSAIEIASAFGAELQKVML